MIGKKIDKKQRGITISSEQLARFDILSGLTSEQIEKVRALITVKRYRNGEEIIVEGNEGEELYLLFKGEVEVSKSLTLMVERGDIDVRDKSLSHLQAEDAPYFGEMSLVREQVKRTATVKAREECLVGVINRDALLNLCRQEKKLGYQLMANIAHTLAERLEKANQDILKLTTALSFVLQR